MNPGFYNHIYPPSLENYDVHCDSIILEIKNVKIIFRRNIIY